MRHMDQIEIDKCYEFYGMAAKVLDFEWDEQDRLTIILGYRRGFTKTYFAEPCPDHPHLFPEIGLPWGEYKRQQQIAGDCTKQAKRMQGELDQHLAHSNAYGEVNYNQWGTRGEIIISGRLNELEVILSELEGVNNAHR